MVAHAFILRIKKSSNSDVIFVQVLHSWAHSFSLNWWLSNSTDNTLRWNKEFFFSFRKEFGEGQWWILEHFFEAFLPEKETPVPWLNRDVFWERLISVQMGNIMNKFERSFL